MNRSLRFAMIGAIFLIVLMIAPAHAASVSDPIEADWYQVRVTQAQYLDIDNDGFQDDILTAFDITVSDTAVSFMTTYVYCYLILPSGSAYLVSFGIIGQYQHLAITLSWYNTVTESGWYTFIVYTEIPVGQYRYYSTHSVTFDPPTGGDPGPPVVGIDITNSTQSS